VKRWGCAKRKHATGPYKRLIGGAGKMGRRNCAGDGKKQEAKNPLDHLSRGLSKGKEAQRLPRDQVKGLAHVETVIKKVGAKQLGRGVHLQQEGEAL